MSDLAENQNPKVLNAREFVCNKQWRELLLYSQSWATEEPDSWLPHYFTGGAASTLGLYELAISATSNALVINPFEQRIWENLATAYEEKGEISRSIETLQEGIQSCRDQQNVKLLLAAGNLMGRRGDDNKALGYFEQALAKDPKCIAAVKGISTSLQNLERIPDLLDLISNNVAALPHLASKYNRLTQRPYLDNCKKWVLQNLRLACGVCRVRFDSPAKAGNKTYLKYGNLLIETIRGTAFCPQCKALTTGAQKPELVSLEQQKKSLHQLMRRFDITRKHINQTSFLARIFKQRKINEEWLKIENRIEIETALLAEADSIRFCNDRVHCEACGSVNAYFIQNIDLIKSSRTLTNVNCPSCKSLLELIGNWGPYQNIRWQPPLPEHDDECQNLYWILEDMGISQKHIINPVIILSNDPLCEARHEKYFGILDSIGGYEADQLPEFESKV